jgi:hypothetical protein
MTEKSIAFVCQAFNKDNPRRKFTLSANPAKQKTHIINKKGSRFDYLLRNGVRGGNRTHSLSLRRRLRYPVTPREHMQKYLRKK